MRILFTLIICTLTFIGTQAQKLYSPTEVGQLILDQKDQSLVAEDVSSLSIERQYTNPKTGITHIYAVQTFGGVPIHNAVASIAISKDGQTKVVNARFIDNVSQRVKHSSSRVLSVDKAVKAAFSQVKLSTTNLQFESSRSTNELYAFASPLLTDDGGQAKSTYFLKNNELILVWDVAFFPKGGSDYWSMRLDASSGELVDQTSFTVHCQFDQIPLASHKHHEKCHQHELVTSSSSGDGAQYLVFPLPVESPLHGERELLIDPSDETASPFGWHDLNGLEGADTEITEGNNVFAYLDRLGTYTKDRDVSGGSDLIFAFTYDGLAEPTDYQDASTTNLFYMVNMMHDFTHAYGFNEIAGNFQDNNYGNGGAGQDAVIALAQFNGESGGNLNNADFSTPGDGGNGTMRMFLWNTRNDISVFNVTAPASVEGPYPSRTASFGPAINETPFTGEVVLVDDEVGLGTDACETIKNGSALEGKIAMIDRGDCEFGFKILNAEQQGAIGAIICNHISGLLSGAMGAGAVGSQVTIPSVFISKADCEKIRVHAGTGLEVNFQTPPADNQPDRVDGSLDNGIIAHEFGHGISNRLTGGPNQTNCLRGSSVGAREEGEQMGEGWSDFFSLVLTVEPGDQGEDPRGIGNYSLRNDIDGPGIRTYPYSTDMSINPVTYYDTYEASIPHGVGQVWCSMIWDMYWLFVERHGWDADFIHGEGGNNMAIQLVMDGMKIQPCNPGFVDGRDGILAADMIINDGENQDIIWEAFARRGLGQFSDQGSSNLVADGKEDYNIPPQYIKSVKLNKSMTPTINKGENILVSLQIRNDLDVVAENIEVIDLIPEGTQVDLTTLPANTTVVDDQIVFEAINLDAATQKTISYELTTPDIPSKLIVFDDMESPDTDGARWITNSVTGNRDFRWAAGYAYSGTYAWEIANIGANHEQSVFNFFDIPITGEHPMVRFAHNYSTDAGNDGGILEISIDGLTTLEDLGESFIRNGYPNNIRRAGFPDNVESAFTGTSGDWILSYADLEDYVGNNAYFQFRFASDANGNSDFWSIDDFTVFDALFYNSEACVTYDGATDMICAEASEYGTIVEPEEYSSTNNENLLEQFVSIYPNPVSDFVTVETNELKGTTEVLARDINGRQIWSRTIDRIQAEPRMSISMNDWSAGMYLIEVRNANQVFTQKVFKN